MKWVNLGVCGLSGLIVATAFTLNITGLSHFNPFIPYILAITAISAFSGLLVKRISVLLLTLLGGFVSLVCCILVLLSVASSI